MKCSRCPREALPGRKRCWVCLQQNQERVAAGRCERALSGQCEWCTRPAVDGKTKCQAHLDANNAATKAWASRRVAP